MAILDLREEGKGNSIQIDTTQLDRFRAVTDSEREFHTSGKSRLDYLNTLYVRESPEQVFAAIGKADPKEAKLFGGLTLPNGWPFYFRGPGASGPVAIPPSLRKDGILSALKIAGRLQFVRETPKMVQELIAAVGGTAVPPIDIEIFSKGEFEKLGKALSTDAVWDFDVPELAVKPEFEDQ